MIALLGAIALIVIAAINPIEQTNRARDTQFKADGSQLIAAIDRYFAANQNFPWVTVDPTRTNDGFFGYYSAQKQGVGICGTDCTTDGVLITSNELQTAFRSRNFITAGASAGIDKQLYIGKATGTSQSVYTCYIPMAKSNRDAAVANGQVYSISTTDGTRTANTSCGTASNPNPSANWVTNACYVCIPT